MCKEAVWSAYAVTFLIYHLTNGAFVCRDELYVFKILRALAVRSSSILHALNSRWPEPRRVVTELLFAVAYFSVMSNNLGDLTFYDDLLTFVLLRNLTPN